MCSNLPRCLEMSTNTLHGEAVLQGANSWISSSTSSKPKSRPSTIYSEMPYTMGGDEAAMPTWSPMHMQPLADNTALRPSGCVQEYLPMTVSPQGRPWPTSQNHDVYEKLTKTPSGGWTQPTCDEVLDFQGLDTEGPIGQAYTTDDTIPIIDLRCSEQSSQDAGRPQTGSGGTGKRRLSVSSLTMSTSGPLSDLPTSFDDFPAALSEAPSYSSDYVSTTSNRTSLMSSIHMSPVASPRSTPQSRSEQVRTQSRGRASPSPRSSARVAPYNLNGAKSQRWSTGSYAPLQTQSRRQSPMIHRGQAPQDYLGNSNSNSSVTQRMSLHGYPQTPAATPQALTFGGYPGIHHQHQHPHPHPHQHQHQHQHQPFVMHGQPMFPGHGMMMPQFPHLGLYPDGRPFEQPPSLPSQGLFKMLQSNGDPHTLQGHYTDLSDPPDLFAPLQEEQIAPPEDDMHPSDASMTPYEQDLRYDGDLYTPKWVRGHGNKREGWCGICKPGRWLVLKNSAFWYDKSFTHGISAATGSAFEEPLDTRRMDGNPDVWEGLCSSCNDWIPLVSSKKKGTTWFRHAYKVYSVPVGPDGERKTNTPISAIPIKRLKTHQSDGARRRKSEANSPIQRPKPKASLRKPSSRSLQRLRRTSARPCPPWRRRFI